MQKYITEKPHKKRGEMHTNREKERQHSTIEYNYIVRNPSRFTFAVECQGEDATSPGSSLY